MSFLDDALRDHDLAATPASEFGVVTLDDALGTVNEDLGVTKLSKTAQSGVTLAEYVLGALAVTGITMFFTAKKGLLIWIGGATAVAVGGVILWSQLHKSPPALVRAHKSVHPPVSHLKKHS